MKLRVVVLGAGFGDLELSTMLSEKMGDRLDLILIDKNDSFFCLAWPSPAAPRSFHPPHPREVSSASPYLTNTLSASERCSRNELGNNSSLSNCRK
ncbi:MAG: hypothetical protein KF734_01015 [Saprospiraceae bacterium]|nr:hypothetical protein [Saprospiraceae bacterium]